MADCNDLFQKFLSEITILKTQRDNLQKGKEAIREIIKRYFSDELEVKEPEFFLQGSYALKTMVRPLGKEDYDLDDAVYLQHTDDDISTPTPATASSWIFEAARKHAKRTENRKNCIRVVYADNYHIDLPIYREINGTLYLGTIKDDKWEPSDAKSFNEWFYSRLEKTEQMRSCIKYLKAWKDFNGCYLKGIHITVLVGISHVAEDGRDDLSLLRTSANMFSYLQENRQIINPIDEKENLINDWDKKKLDSAIEAIEALHEKANQAIKTNDEGEASMVWRKVFGDRFPEHGGRERGNRIVGPSRREFVPKTKPWSGC
jgi:hypothetical protein